ncbi:cytokine receptor common subunit beta isoform X2 [Colossoma macropomum]|uniref:cytokine receptor common subunit beta isoform X2 n=1 Tax=Colossoma macropomum TaxID=42526 RepID=UPI001864B0E7|nr:cytokine receptor common subunit beta isoform X2 [Colossoma macropomum]
MMPMRTLLFTALPLLVLSSKFEQCSLQSTTFHGHPVLDSLQCYNDFTTHMHCTWEEDPHTPLQLLIKNEKNDDCVSDGLGMLLPNGKRYRSCVYKTKIFHWGKWTVYFTTSCPSKEATLNIAQHGKVLSPVNVMEKKVDGGRMLSWSSPYPSSSPLTNSLTYQVKYRRHGHDWIVVDNINTNQWVIKEQELPGYGYEARVRARGRVGMWSNWSPPVSWITEEEEGVFNLQCVIEERGVSCSWQVKREHAQFLSFYLCSHTNGSNLECQHCDNHINQPGHVVLDFTCLVVASEPEMLTMELKSVHNSKDFANTLNIQPPRLNRVQVSEKDGIWKLTWSRPNVSEALRLFYQLQLYNNDTGDFTLFNLTEGDFCLNLNPSNLRPTNTYMARVRALPSDSFRGRPSDWSEPVYFKSGSAFSIAAIIYIMTALFVAMFFIVLYKALPSCHRRLELWKVSIPSPIKSRVLEEISNKSSPAVRGNLYSEKEKTSVCIMQPSDNPIICKGSISEYPLLPYSDDDLTKSECTHGLDHTSSYIEGSGMSVKSTMSFTGPYILCQQDSSSQSETLDTSFYSNSTFEEDSRSIINENATDSLAANGGYVSSPPTSLPSTEHSASSDNPATGGTNPGLLQLPKDDPPAYTPNPTAMPGVLFSNRSGYCLMPNMEINVAAWVQVSAPPPGGNTDSQSVVAGDGDQSARGYVTLSQPAI